MYLMAAVTATTTNASGNGKNSSKTNSNGKKKKNHKHSGGGGSACGDHHISSGMGPPTSGGRGGKGAPGSAAGAPSKGSNMSASVPTTAGSPYYPASPGAGGGQDYFYDYDLLEMDENDNSFPWGLIHHNELASMLTAGLGKNVQDESVQARDVLVKSPAQI